MILDDIRARYPTLGICVYAMVPGEAVTLETYTPDGQVFSFTGPTVEAALARAFPDLDDPDWKGAFAAQSRKLQHVLHIPGVKETLAELLDPPAEDEPVEPAASVFD